MAKLNSVKCRGVESPIKVLRSSDSYLNTQTSRTWTAQGT